MALLNKLPWYKKKTPVQNKKTSQQSKGKAGKVIKSAATAKDLRSEIIYQRDNPVLDGAAVIFQTSGTTAEPKLVPCLHSSLLASAERVRKWFNLNKHDRCLSIMPPYFSHGLTFTILAPLLSGGSVAFPTSPSKVNLAEWFGELKPTWFSASPTTHLAISEMLGSTFSGLKHHLRMAVAGGAQLPENVRSSLQLGLGIPIFC